MILKLKNKIYWKIISVFEYALVIMTMNKYLYAFHGIDFIFLFSLYTNKLFYDDLCNL